MKENLIISNDKGIYFLKELLNIMKLLNLFLSFFLIIPALTQTVPGHVIYIDKNSREYQDSDTQIAFDYKCQAVPIDQSSPSRF
jgi:hypothetical protein